MRPVTVRIRHNNDGTLSMEPWPAGAHTGAVTRNVLDTLISDHNTAMEAGKIKARAEILSGLKRSRDAWPAGSVVHSALTGEIDRILDGA